MGRSSICNWQLNTHLWNPPNPPFEKGGELIRPPLKKGGNQIRTDTLHEVLKHSTGFTTSPRESASARDYRNVRFLVRRTNQCVAR